MVCGVCHIFLILQPINAIILEKYEEKNSPWAQTMSEVSFVPVFVDTAFHLSGILQITSYTFQKNQLVLKKIRRRKKTFTMGPNDARRVVCARFRCCRLQSLSLSRISQIKTYICNKVLASIKNTKKKNTRMWTGDGGR